MTRTLAAIRATRGGVTAATGDVLVAPAVGGARAAVRALGKRLAAVLERRVRATGYRGGDGETIAAAAGGQELVLIGVGAETRAAWRRFGARARREMDARQARRAAIFVPQTLDARALSALAEGVHLAGYRFDAHRSPERPSRLRAVRIVGPAVPEDAAGALEEAATVASFVCDARDLVNEPASVATPTHLATYAREAARGTRSLAVEVWDAARMAREGAAGVLAVARGTKEPPRFIVMRYRPAGARRHVALVGKGITFDSGGLSLKPPKSMETMKYDMAGGAAVLATVAAAARLGLGVRVTGFVPATENLPGHAAQKPGDVIRYANGKTVEVLNTDAEGRLVLADALIFASRERPDAIVDLATLTGAARVALGARLAPVIGTDPGLVGALRCAGEGAGERLWELPLADDLYGDDLKGAVADLRNIGQGPEAGTIVAAIFLRHFVDGAPWAHLDIAGPAFAEKDWPECPRGASGFGVRLLLEYLRGVAAAPA